MSLSYNAGTFGACFFYLFSGMIAGTVASFIVRGRLGCLLGNFFLGIVGAIVANFLINLVFKFIPLSGAARSISVGFFGTTLIASIGATLVAYIVYWLSKAEKRQQARLLEKYGAHPPGAPPQP